VEEDEARFNYLLSHFYGRLRFVTAYSVAKDLSQSTVSAGGVENMVGTW
jgi:hypothetical protein